MRQGFIKVAALTPKVTVADTQANRKEICRLMDEAEAKGAKILVFPELCITGYTCGDLFYQQVLLREAKKGRLRLQNIRSAKTIWLLWDFRWNITANCIMLRQL